MCPFFVPDFETFESRQDDNWTEL